jgi:hypothetical protein
MPKTVLFKKLQESFDLDRLQRVEARRRKKAQENLLKRKAENVEEITTSVVTNKKRRSPRQMPSNTYDPVMLTQLGKKNIWKYVRPNGNIFNCFIAYVH